MNVSKIMSREEFAAHFPFQRETNLSQTFVVRRNWIHRVPSLQRQRWQTGGEFSGGPQSGAGRKRLSESVTWHAGVCGNSAIPDSNGLQTEVVVSWSGKTGEKVKTAVMQTSGK
jgi:hypothetical protein